jgi:hypothetical protein
MNPAFKSTAYVAHHVDLIIDDNAAFDIHASLDVRFDFHTYSSPFSFLMSDSATRSPASRLAIAAVHLYRRKRVRESITETDFSRLPMRK